MDFYSLAISIERWIHLSRISSGNQKMWKQLYPILRKGEFEKARQMANKDKSTIAQMLGMGLARQGAVRRRDDIEIADGDHSPIGETYTVCVPALQYRYIAGAARHHHGTDRSLYRGG